MNNLFRYLSIGIVFTIIANLYFIFDYTNLGGSSGYSPKTYAKGGNNIVVPIDGLNKRQIRLLHYAYVVAKQDHHIHPEILQGILWQESRVGTVKNYKVAGQEFGLPKMKRYYGIGQIKISAARHILSKWPEMGNFKTDEELVAHLILDDEFNIRMASKYLLITGIRKNGSYRGKNFQITAYNQGIGGAFKKNINTWHYTIAVNRHMRTIIKKFNDKRINTARVDI